MEKLIETWWLVRGSIRLLGLGGIEGFTLIELLLALGATLVIAGITTLTVAIRGGNVKVDEVVTLEDKLQQKWILSEMRIVDQKQGLCKDYMRSLVAEVLEGNFEFSAILRCYKNGRKMMIMLPKEMKKFSKRKRLIKAHERLEEAIDQEKATESTTSLHLDELAESTDSFGDYVLRRFAPEPSSCFHSYSKILASLEADHQDFVLTCEKISEDGEGSLFQAEMVVGSSKIHAQFLNEILEKNFPNRVTEYVSEQTRAGH